MNDPYDTPKESMREYIKIIDWYKDKLHLEQKKNKELEEKIKQMTPCDRCMFSPPSSCDGKPCCMCPANKITEEGE